MRDFGRTSVPLHFASNHQPRERLIEILALTPSPPTHAARQFDWKRTGPNHGGDGTKVCLTAWRWFTHGQKDGSGADAEAPV